MGTEEGLGTDEGLGFKVDLEVELGLETSLVEEDFINDGWEFNGLKRTEVCIVELEFNAVFVEFERIIVEELEDWLTDCSTVFLIKSNESERVCWQSFWPKDEADHFLEAFTIKLKSDLERETDFKESSAKLREVV